MSKQLSPLQSIRSYCAECNGESKGGKKYDCLDHNCEFYPWKLGKGVYEIGTDYGVSQEHKDWLAKHGTGVKKRAMTEEAKQKATERMKKAWETRKKNNQQQENENES